ncbi:hypothetical protein D7X94_11590 [Acutalibacter sp. 1XD8-33]|uniref:DUF4190 domain-containing protein n=1 Tax=Acutalibacter sp. 1XD8-33 TaxID=2320081 RepID=UPI000EA248F3|nr:DUF4190 domain-containing protein [Acutalibacter sp. 1XD8-33]RKJ39599.1 hypothetical protein D7X94_11590 [Acutalibacter sp. 1XD8-33]
MKQCAHCGQWSEDQAPACAACGAPLPPSAPVPAQPLPYTPPGFVPRPVRPGTPVPSVPPALFPRQKPFTWMDICTVLGFTSSLVGYFFTSIVLLPLGLVASILGFRGDRTRGLAVAGIVISALGLLIRIMVLLTDCGLLPHWVANGVW